MRRYPLAAATKASPMPVLPDVERFNHGNADAILHRVRRIEELQLTRDDCALRDPRRHAVEPDEWRVPDQFRDVRGDLHGFLRESAPEWRARVLQTSSAWG